jgi:methyltransferase-like protein/ubiquinone/menaquinone biosynthesis C-methylase UbiE
MTKAILNTYNAVSYPGYPFPQAHPDRLATLATLFGMNPARIDDCSVLELGCGDGAHLIPMALAFPESNFVGIDLASEPIAKAREISERLGLGNITLRELDIMDVPAHIGEFDYVIAHGLYSWVPPAVRDKVLAICKASLAPDGVAYVSYNTYPGGHLREMLREMMLFHIREIQEPVDRISQARAFVRFLTESQSGSDLYKTIAASWEQEIGRLHDGALFHDHLADINSPVYFHQFMAHAANHGLQYLAEADFFDMQYEAIAPEAAETLRRLAVDDIVACEQYLDFLTCRRFRQTLLCHEQITIDRGLNPERVTNQFVASSARPVSEEVAIDSTSVEVFQGRRGTNISTNHPLTKSALLKLASVWPRSIRFKDLLEAVRKELASSLARTNGDVDGEDRKRLSEFLLKAYAANVIELHVQPSEFVLEPGERPTASRLARLQLRDSSTVTTLRHTSVQVMDPIGRYLLMLLDGTRDKDDLLRELSKLVESGQIKIRREDETVAHSGAALEVLSKELEQNLTKVARLGLLVA